LQLSEGRDWILSVYQFILRIKHSLCHIIHNKYVLDGWIDGWMDEGREGGGWEEGRKR
jgi:hypothetical protein